MAIIALSVDSDPKFQMRLVHELERHHPEVEPQQFIRKSLGAPQTTNMLIEGALLIVSILQLIVSLRKEMPDSTSTITIKNSDSLVIKTDQEFDPEKIVKEFLKHT